MKTEISLEKIYEDCFKDETIDWFRTHDAIFKFFTYYRWDRWKFYTENSRLFGIDSYNQDEINRISEFHSDVCGIGVASRKDILPGEPEDMTEFREYMNMERWKKA
ncbi:hypothetical protein [Emticicia sp. C21]|uniref:hypothetical protein n=1 Tax=Emticicia sp. C21 TaxID=2302915 RepID=UPI000E3415CA|nr:hypothetical protein [Emticicia sp. C21]RFS15991.1 hypothetical protein D0T08_13915 [Emticicia sp. C21]